MWLDASMTIVCAGMLRELVNAQVWQRKPRLTQ